MRKGTLLVVPSARRLSYWWRWVNAHGFDNSLPAGVSFRTHTDEESRRSHGCSTLAIYYQSELEGYGVISFWNQEQFLAQLVSTMAHEMIHQEQHMLGLPMTHGRQFKTRCKQLSRKLGIPIS